MEERRDEPTDGLCEPPVSQALERRNHQSLRQDAVNHGDTASDDSGRGQRLIMQVHIHTPLYGE